MTDQEDTPPAGCPSCNAWVAATVPLIRGQRVNAWSKCPECNRIQILQDRPPTAPELEE